MSETTLQNTLIVVRHPKGVIPNRDPSEMGGADMAELARFFESLAGGMSPGQPGDVTVNLHRGSTDAAPKRATQTSTIASGNGTTTITINGVAIAITWATSDANSASLLAAAVNASADALIAGLVQACNLACTIAVASLTAGQWVDIDGVRFTARATATPRRPDEFAIGATDTATGDNLRDKINDHPRLRDVFLASNSSGTVTLRQLTGTTGKHVYKEGAGITLGGLSSGLLAATGTVLYSSIQKSKLANCITTAATGTNHTAAGARLTGGVGGDAVAKVFRA